LFRSFLAVPTRGGFYGLLARHIEVPEKVLIAVSERQEPPDERFGDEVLVPDCFK
jgi:hypothetical protein